MSVSHQTLSRKGPRCTAHSRQVLVEAERQDVLVMLRTPLDEVHRGRWACARDGQRTRRSHTGASRRLLTRKGRKLASWPTPLRLFLSGQKSARTAANRCYWLRDNVDEVCAAPAMSPPERMRAKSDPDTSRPPRLVATHSQQVQVSSVASPQCVKPSGSHLPTPNGLRPRSEHRLAGLSTMLKSCCVAESYYDIVT